jgi:hypothetical protein
MSCEACEAIQNVALDKNIAETVPIIYVRVENANVAILACTKHAKILIERNRTYSTTATLNEKTGRFE